MSHAKDSIVSAREPIAPSPLTELDMALLRNAIAVADDARKRGRHPFGALVADVVGMAHAGLGIHMLGSISPQVFTSYSQWPALAAALLKAGFTSVETGQILGGNYRRAFEATMA